MPATLHASEITVEFGRRMVLDRVGITLAPGHRVGLLGPNGVGKSTLLKVLVGLRTPDRGKVVLAPAAATVGLLAQEHERTDESIRDYLSRRTGVAAADVELEAATNALATGEPGADDRYGTALDQWLGLGAADFDTRLEQVWAELGLPEEMLLRRTQVLSGGELARVGLAALMLNQYDVLLLDEPTNDLDLAGLARLEQIVTSSANAQLIVSHDRTFLERVVTDVVELDEQAHTLSWFSGGWTAFLAEKAVARRHAEEAFADYADKKATLATRAQRERQWMTEGVAKSKRQQSDNDKLQRKAKAETTEQLAGRASRTERAIERLTKVDKPWEGWDLRFEIAAATRSGDVVCRLEQAVIERGDFSLGPIDLEINYGERIAIVGENGAGKSTLLAAILGRIPLTSGHRSGGAGLIVGEIDQGRLQFDSDDSLVDRFIDVTKQTQEEARTLLAKFGLTAAHVMRSVRSLSPGERTRATLALLQATGVNLLCLDEPTNHLDLPAIEQLEQALETFAGTVLLITHDRSLLANVRVTRQFTVANGRVTSGHPTSV